MDDNVRGAMHYIAAEIDSREWVEGGFATLGTYLAWWSLFRTGYPPTESTWQEPHDSRP